MSNDYLYGKDVEVPEIPEEIIVRRLEALKDRLHELMEIPYLDRDDDNIHAMHKAISFWEKINDV